jgi:hypothetical protein
MVQSQPGQTVHPISRPYPEKPFTKIGLVEWLKAKALSSSPSAKGGKKQNKTGLVWKYGAKAGLSDSLYRGGH